MLSTTACIAFVIQERMVDGCHVLCVVAESLWPPGIRQFPASIERVQLQGVLAHMDVRQLHHGERTCFCVFVYLL